MRDALVLDLADCSEFRQSLQARPPSIAHGATILMVAILGTTLVWLAATRANLVVRAVGRVRPVTMPVKVFNAARGEALSASVGGRVVEVNVHQGDEVKRGDILVRLETERLDNEIAKRRRMIRAGEEELASLAQLEKLSSHQFEASRAKTEAELAQRGQGSAWPRSSGTRRSAWPGWRCGRRNGKKQRSRGWWTGGPRRRWT